MMRMSNRRPGDPPKKGYETRVPENARYADVSAKVSSGRTAAKVKYLTNRQVLRRRGESRQRALVAARCRLHRRLIPADRRRPDRAHHSLVDALEAAGPLASVGGDALAVRRHLGLGLRHVDDVRERLRHGRVALEAKAAARRLGRRGNYDEGP